MRIIFLSSCAAALPTLQMLHGQGHSVSLLCMPASEGRSARSERELLEGWAAEAQMPCWQVEHDEWNMQLSELIRETAPDLVLAFGFPATINPMLLEPVRHGGWNVHFSLLPAPLPGALEGCVYLHSWPGNQGSNMPIQRRSGIPIDSDQPFAQLGKEAAILLNEALLHISGLHSLLGWSKAVS